MPKIEVRTESEQPRGWAYEVLMHHDDGSVSHHSVSMSWSDHELWCGGRLPPSRVVELALGYAADHGHADDWPPKFDIGRVRRWLPKIDRELRIEH